jgi:hypothetical protein
MVYRIAMQGLQRYSGLPNGLESNLPSRFVRHPRGCGPPVEHPMELVDFLTKLRNEVLFSEHGKFLLHLPWFQVSLVPFDELLGIQDRIMQQAAVVLEEAACSAS